MLNHPYKRFIDTHTPFQITATLHFQWFHTDLFTTHADLYTHPFPGHHFPTYFTTQIQYTILPYLIHPYFHSVYLSSSLLTPFPVYTHTHTEVRRPWDLLFMADRPRQPTNHLLACHWGFQHTPVHKTYFHGAVPTHHNHHPSMNTNTEAKSLLLLHTTVPIIMDCVPIKNVGILSKKTTRYNYSLMKNVC